MLSIGCQRRQPINSSDDDDWIILVKTSSINPLTFKNIDSNEKKKQAQDTNLENKTFITLKLYYQVIYHKIISFSFYLSLFLSLTNDINHIQTHTTRHVCLSSSVWRLKWKHWNTKTTTTHWMVDDVLKNWNMNSEYLTVVMRLFCNVKWNDAVCLYRWRIFFWLFSSMN